MVKIHLFKTLEINQNLAHKYPQVLIKKEKNASCEDCKVCGI